MKYLLLFTVGIFLAFSNSVLANSYYNNSYSNYKDYNRFVYEQPVDNFYDHSYEYNSKDEFNNAYEKDYHEDFYTNPSVTPYYYPDNNQRSHQKENPFNYIY